MNRETNCLAVLLAVQKSDLSLVAKAVACFPRHQKKPVERGRKARLRDGFTVQSIEH